MSSFFVQYSEFKSISRSVPIGICLHETAHAILFFLCVCLCERARGGFSDSICCDGGGWSVSLSCCAAEAVSRSEITERLTVGVHVSCVYVCVCLFVSFNCTLPTHRW